MTIKTWKASQFTKQKNSTKQPGSSPTPTSHTVRLKDPASITHPTIIFDGHITPTDIGYAYIDKFERYYFVSDYRYDGPNTEIDFISDPMASFKNEIESYEGMITRCQDSSWYNKRIADPLNPATNDFDCYIAKETGTPMFTSTDFCCLLTVMGKSSVVVADGGMTTTYVLDATNLIQLNLVLNQGNFWQNLVAEFTNPMDAILSCKIVPISYSNAVWGSTTGNVYIGSQIATGVTGKIVMSRWQDVAISLGVPSGVTSLDNYRQSEPYATYSLYLPFVGVVPLSYQAIKGGTLYLRKHIDFYSCDISYEVRYSTGDTFTPYIPIATYSGNFATEAPISHQSYSAMGVTGGILATIGGAAALATAAISGGASLVPGLGAMAGGIGTTIKSLEQHTQVNGNMSSGLGVRPGNLIIMMAFIKKLATTLTDNLLTVGLPCYKNDFISSHPGFIQMYAPSVKCSRATESELANINSMLAGGFYYQ